MQRLGASPRLRRTLGSTNPAESMIEIVRRIQRNVKHWQDGDMRLRWTAAAMLEAERQFRRIIGYRDLARLAVAVERDVTAVPPPSRAHAMKKEALEIVTVCQPGPPSKFNDGRDILASRTASRRTSSSP